ncbi:MAG: SRPBCC domain-containing protein [Gelidibacter sp.]
METLPIIIEETFNSSSSKIWKAITDKNEMKQWYFDLKEFKPKVGFKFDFTGGPDDGQQYLHLCEVTEVEHEKKLSYSWRYDGYEGISYVAFELIPNGSKTKLRLTHKGLETFPKSNPDLAAKNFRAGWNDIIHQSLKRYLEK